MVRKERLELSRVSPPEPKSGASTSSATFASGTGPRKGQPPAPSTTGNYSVRISGTPRSAPAPSPRGPEKRDDARADESRNDREGRARARCNDAAIGREVEENDRDARGEDGAELERRQGGLDRRWIVAGCQATGPVRRGLGNLAARLVHDQFSEALDRRAGEWWAM